MRLLIANLTIAICVWLIIINRSLRRWWYWCEVSGTITMKTGEEDALQAGDAILVTSLNFREAIRGLPPSRLLLGDFSVPLARRKCIPCHKINRCGRREETLLSMRRDAEALPVVFLGITGSTRSTLKVCLRWKGVSFVGWLSRGGTKLWKIFGRRWIFEIISSEKVFVEKLSVEMLFTLSSSERNLG